MIWTTEDFLAGKCKAKDIGEEQNTGTILSSKDLVNEYLAVYAAIGGRNAMEKVAKENPQRFYSELLKLLIAMEAPKATMAVQVNVERAMLGDVRGMKSEDIRALLLSRRPPDDVVDV